MVRAVGIEPTTHGLRTCGEVQRRLPPDSISPDKEGFRQRLIMGRKLAMPKRVTAATCGILLFMILGVAIIRTRCLERVPEESVRSGGIPGDFVGAGRV